jgi:uncharacterized membrane protein
VTGHERVLVAIAGVPFAMAVVVVVVGLLRMPFAGRAAPAELAAALGLGLELLLAAGLLRLAALDDLLALGAVAAIIAIRRVLGIGLRTAVAALGASRFVRLRA